MPLGREVGLGPGDIVLDEYQAPLPKMGHSSPPLFGPCLLWPNGSMHQDATWYGGRPCPRPHCVRWGPNSPPKKGDKGPLNFWPMSILAKQSPISATAEHLLYVAWWHNGWANGRRTCDEEVVGLVPCQGCCVTTLSKLFTSLSSCYQAVSGWQCSVAGKLIIVQASHSSYISDISGMTTHWLRLKA